MEKNRRILITGATGILGERAGKALKTQPGVVIVRLGRNHDNRPDVVTADMTGYSPDWAKHFAGIDAVLHLAADPSPEADWPAIQTSNIDLSLNVLRAAEENAVKRFVFASSNWVFAGYRFSGRALNARTPACPVNPYGASKFFIERYGLSLSSRTGMAFLSLRIGYCQPGDNIPGPQMSQGRWGQEMWLSNRDWEQAVIKACCAPFSGAALINIVSRNKGMRWNLQEAQQAIGYSPLSRHVPQLGVYDRLKDRLAQLQASLRQPLAPGRSSRRDW